MGYGGQKKIERVHISDDNGSWLERVIALEAFASGADACPIKSFYHGLTNQVESAQSQRSYVRSILEKLLREAVRSAKKTFHTFDVELHCRHRTKITAILVSKPAPPSKGLLPISHRYEPALLLCRLHLSPSPALSLPLRPLSRFLLLDAVVDLVVR